MPGAFLDRRTMQGYQRIKALDLLTEITDVDYEDIVTYDDFGLEAWLYELGYDWDADKNKWVEYAPPPVFGESPLVATDTDFGPLFIAL
jgi:hypothetical protein